MEMEHINENTIKVIIENADLEARGITFFDLLSNQKKVENFFYSILDEVDARHEFEGLDAVTFQVVPKPNGLDLYITKGMSLELKEINKKENINLEDLDLDPLEQVIQYLKKEMNDKQPKTEKMSQANQTKFAKKQTKYQVFRFDDFDDFTELAQLIEYKQFENVLYYYNNQYYWAYQLETVEDVNYIEQLNLLTKEFAEKSKISFSVLQEHAQIIMEEDALKTAQHYFK